MAYQSEAALEQQFIEQLNKQEYTTVAIPDYDALVENFKVQFEAFNAPKLDTPITDKEWERIFNLMLGKSVFQSAKILRDKFVLEREDGTKVYLSFFDQDHTKNIFQVTHQTTVVGKYVNRYDVTILVNGLPLIQVELKRRGIDIREAVNQVMRYKKHSYNGLYHFIQLFIVSNGVDTKYFANSDRDLMYSLAFFWTDFNNVRITNLKDFSISFLARDHIIKMLTRYTILNDTDKILMVMRPYQVYAVEALIRQATLTNRNAYIWHTTGAGKTLTSFKTAQILAANPNIKKVIFLVDRKDLDSQTTEEFNKFEAGSVDVTDRTDVLVRQMDCNSTNISFSTGEISQTSYSFDVSTVEMRTEIINSISEKIAAYAEEIQRLSAEICAEQEKMQSLMEDENVSLESIVAYKKDIFSASDAEGRIKDIENEITSLKSQLVANENSSQETQARRVSLLTAILGKMNELYHQIDPDGNLTYTSLFTQRNEVYSGSEATVFHLVKLFALQQVLRHNCPIIVDSFRAEDLSTGKEKTVLEISKSINNQVILTTTLKHEELGKYDSIEGVNHINYISHIPSKILDGRYVADFLGLLSALSIKVQS